MDIADITPRTLTLPGLFAVLLSGCGHLPVLIVPRDPLSTEEHARLGATYEAQGLQKEAEAQYVAALEKDSDYVPALMAAGNAAFASGDLKSAARLFRRVLKLSPDYARAQNNLAMTYLAQNKDLDEAELLAQKAAALDGPLKPYFLDTLANVYLRQKRYTEAQAALEQAQAVTPADNDTVRKQLLVTRALLDTAQRPQPHAP